MHRVAVDTLSALANKENNEVAVEIGTVDGTVVTMNVKRFLSMKDFSRFVSEMAHSQFTDSDEFESQLYSIIFDVALCEYYTNLNLPDKIGEAYELVQKLGLKRKVLDVVERSTQYTDLIKCIEEAHDFIKTEKMGLNGLFGVLKKVVSDFDVKDILETLKDFDLEKLEHLSEIKELAGVFNTMQGTSESAEK